MPIRQELMSLAIYKVLRNLCVLREFTYKNARINANRTNSKQTKATNTIVGKHGKLTLTRQP